MLVKRRAQGCLRSPKVTTRIRSCASLPPSVSATPHKPQAFGYQKHPIEIHAGRSSARSVRQRAGAALHAFILTRCLLRTRLGNAALIPAGHLNYAPNLLNTLACDQVIRPVMWRHSKMLRVLQQHHSCALLPAMGFERVAWRLAISALSQNVRLMFGLRRWRLPTGWVLLHYNW